LRTPVFKTGALAILPALLHLQFSNLDTLVTTRPGLLVAFVALGAVAGCAAPESPASPPSSVGLAPRDTIIVSATAITIEPFELRILDAAVVGPALTGTPTWSSSDTTVVTVSTGALGSGWVRGRATGTGIVTAALGGKKTQVTVTVKLPRVAAVYIGSGAPRTLLVGQKVNYFAGAYDPVGNYLPNEQYVWATSNPAVVSIDQTGVATAVSAGTATISATLEGKTGTADLLVQPVYEQVTNGDFESDFSSGWREYRSGTASISREHDQMGFAAVFRANGAEGLSCAGNVNSMWLGQTFKAQRDRIVDIDVRMPTEVIDQSEIVNACENGSDHSKVVIEVTRANGSLVGRGVLTIYPPFPGLSGLHATLETDDTDGNVVVQQSFVWTGTPLTLTAGAITLIPHALGGWMTISVNLSAFPDASSTFTVTASGDIYDVGGTGKDLTFAIDNLRTRAP
jgi:hypothetical protein